MVNLNVTRDGSALSLNDGEFSNSMFKMLIEAAMKIFLIPDRSTTTK
jgi:hypothetical protein